MYRKVTYGITGLIDWNAIIRVGRARLSIHFSGGAVTKYGVSPAEFTTADPITQRIIEDSAYYRSGRIRTLRSTGPQPEHNGARRVAPGAQTEAKTIDVSCLHDAIDYMRDNYNISSLDMRTADALRKVASRYGITFKFPDGK